jgi:adenylosuccinate lyase
MFNLKKEDIEKELDPAKYTGRAASQVVEFISDFVDPLLKKYKGEEITTTLKV